MWASVSIPTARADAVRNCDFVLATAEQFFAERGVAAVSMDDIAAAAGVGKGTVYRHFGDRALQRHLRRDRKLDGARVRDAVVEIAPSVMVDS